MTKSSSQEVMQDDEDIFSPLKNSVFQHNNFHSGVFVSMCVCVCFLIIFLGNFLFNDWLLTFGVPLDDSPGRITYWDCYSPLLLKWGRNNRHLVPKHLVIDPLVREIEHIYIYTRTYTHTYTIVLPFSFSSLSPYFAIKAIANEDIHPIIKKTEKSIKFCS